MADMVADVAGGLGDFLYKAIVEPVANIISTIGGMITGASSGTDNAAAFVQLGQLLAPLLTGLTYVLNLLTPVILGLTLVIAGLPVLIGAVLLAVLPQVIAALMDLPGTITSAMSKTLSVALIDPLVGELEKLKGAASGGTAGAGMLKITELLAGFAAELEKIPSAMQPFVAALAPGVIEQYNYAQRTLSATIGTALLPAFQVMSRVVRDAAGLLAPAMQALQPIMTALAQIVSQTVLPAIQQVSVVIQAFGPLVAGLISDLMPILTGMTIVFTAVIRTIVGWIQALLGSNVKSATDSFRSAIEFVVKHLVLLSARLAMFLGITSYVDALQKTAAELSTEKPQGVAPAPENIRTSGLEDIARQMAEAAVMAGGGPAPEDPQIKMLGDIAADLKTMSQARWDDVLKKFFVDVMGPGLAAPITKGIQDAYLWIKRNTSDAVGGAVSGVVAGVAMAAKRFGL